MVTSALPACVDDLRAPFPPDGDLHLNSAGVAPLSGAARQALAGLEGAIARGTLGLPEVFARLERARSALAQLTGAAPGDVAFQSTCAAALSQVALGLPLRPGDELVLLDQEYPSNAYPWLRAAERRGAVVRRVSSRPDFTVDLGALRDAVSARTRVLACSWVQFQTGTTLELPALADVVHRVGGLLVVDAIQGLGVIPFSLAETGTDIVCGGSQKWLMGPLGMGFLAARPGLVDLIEPVLYGAMTYGTPDDAVEPERRPRPDARRFEPGGPPVHAACATGASAEALLAIGLSAVNAAARALSDALVEGLASRGYRVLPRSTRSPIVSFLPRRLPGDLLAALRAAGCAVAARAGGIRVSPHAHNRPEHIECFLDLLDVLDR